jgi:hypothetical protein
MVTFAAALVLPMEAPVPIKHGWELGPWPIPFSGKAADAPTRSTYFEQRAAGVLYSQKKGRRRLHRQADRHLFGPFRLEALEWLETFDHSALAGLLLLHVCGVEEAATVLHPWSELVRWRLDEDPSIQPAEGQGDPMPASRAIRIALEEELGAPVAIQRLHRSPWRMAYLDQVPTDTPPFPGTELSPVEAWQFALASGLSPGSFTPSPGQVAELQAARIELSSDWSAMVLRDGAAFLGHADVNPHFVATVAGPYTRSIYTDALLLGVLQGMTLIDLTDRLASLDDPARHPRAVERLDAEFSRFRNRLWWQHLSHGGPGNALILAHQAQHRLPELMEQTKSELDDYSRQAGLRAGRVLNIVVAALALVGAIGVAADLYRFFVPAPAVPAPATRGWFVGVAALVALVVITYPLGILGRGHAFRSTPFVPRSLRRERRKAKARWQLTRPSR